MSHKDISKSNNNGDAYRRKLNPITRFTASASAAKLATAYTMLMGLIFAIFFVTSVFSSGRATDTGMDGLVLGAVSIIALCVILRIFAEKAIEGQRNRLNDTLGMRLSSQDRVRLASWHRYCIKPSVAHLQPALPKYIDYMEEILTGKNLAISRKTQFILFAIAVYNVVSTTIVMIATSSAAWHRVLLLLSSILLALLYFPARKGNGNWIISKLNIRQLRKLQRMREQI